MGVPPIISGTGKATDFKFGRYIDSVYVNKSPLKTPGTVAICVVRKSCPFSVTHTLGASCGYLCDSTAFLYYSESTVVLHVGLSLDVQVVGVTLSSDVPMGRQ